VAIPRTVLLVDDNPAIRTALYTILTDAGYEVWVASDGEAAISPCKGRTIDLLITDLIIA
jgi:CheY-like chemotaxis protein